MHKPHRKYTISIVRMHLLFLISKVVLSISLKIMALAIPFSFRHLQKANKTKFIPISSPLKTWIPFKVLLSNILVLMNFFP